MNPSLIAMLTAGVIFALGGFVVKAYGNARFEAGRLRAHQEQFETLEAALKGAEIKKEKHLNESKRLTIDDLDRRLSDAGWMRADRD